MRTDDFRPSSNVEDDREASASRGMPGGGGGLGIGAVIIVGLVSWYLGVDPNVILNHARRARFAVRADEPGSIRRARDAERRDRKICRAGAGRHRGSLDRDFCRQRANLSSAKAASVRGLGADAMCFRPLSHGPVLLPARSTYLSRHVILPGHAAKIRRLLGCERLQVLRSLCHRPRSRASRPG